jgi:S-adenosylmethionine hydrolase
MKPIITLTTDFGDGRYIAQMKGVLLGLCRDATIVDIAHDIPPQDMLTAAYLLRDVVPSFPPGTVHVAVVDPGVGSSRRGIALQTGPRAEGQFLVGPDNGIFSFFLENAATYELVNPQYRRSVVSSVFHGRDVFTPAAAHLANGVALDAFGPRVRDPVRLALPTARRSADQILGEALYVDRFGNVVTNIETSDLPKPGEDGLRVEIGWAKIDKLSRTYSEVGVGEMIALIGSSGRLEIAIREGHAAERLGLKQARGTAVKVCAAQPSMYGA